MKHQNDFREIHFRRSVEKALGRVRTILDTTRQLRLAADEGNHTYDDKFSLAEFLVNTCNAAQLGALEHLGLDDGKCQTIGQWVHHDKQSVTLRFQAEDTCVFLKENTVELPQENEFAVETKTITTTTGEEGGSVPAAKETICTEAVKAKIIQKVTEKHWKVEFHWRLLIFKGSDPHEQSSFVELDSRHASAIIITEAPTGKKGQISPISSSTVHPHRSINITWLFQQISPNDRSFQFVIDRATSDAGKRCKTPRRNENVDDAMKFYKEFHAWTSDMVHFFCTQVEDRIMAKNKPTRPPPSGMEQSGQTLKSINDHGSFVPIVPWMENASILSKETVETLLTEQNRSLDEMICSNLSKSYPPRPMQSIISIAEATILLISKHLKSLITQCNMGLDYLENLLKQQLVKAIGKEVSSKDFDDFMKYYNRKFFGPSYAPRPFTYAIRRPHHYPDGILSIERKQLHDAKTASVNGKHDVEPIETFVRHVDGAHHSPFFLPINAATTVELQGDIFLHGWMQHIFESSEKSPPIQLVARARQFSSFMLIVGSLMGPNQVYPQHALILQNKDQVLIPLLTEMLPSAKDFKKAICSLSPEQQAFAKAFRAMQLESSVFVVGVIQLKPQLERLLGLPHGSLTKEIQLTQDLMSLFVDYQIPSDLFSCGGSRDGSDNAADQVATVKGHVKSVLDVINNEKTKQLEKEKLATEKKRLDKENIGRTARKRSFFDDSDDASEQNNYVCDGACVDKNDEKHDDLEEEEEEECGYVPRSGIRPTAMAKRQKVSEDDLKGYNMDPGCLDLETNPPTSDHSVIDASGRNADGSDKTTAMTTTEKTEDFTVIPKTLDAKLEQFDTDNALRSTIIKAVPNWSWEQRDLLSTEITIENWQTEKIERAKKSAFDLLDAISRSGTLPIQCSELHVVIGLSHCFENDIMGTLVQDNINPIAKVEKSSVLLASTIHGLSIPRLLNDNQTVERLTGLFPQLMEE